MGIVATWRFSYVGSQHRDHELLPSKVRYTFLGPKLRSTMGTLSSPTPDVKSCTPTRPPCAVSVMSRVLSSISARFSTSALRRSTAPRSPIHCPRHRLPLYEENNICLLLNARALMPA